MLALALGLTSILAFVSSARAWEGALWADYARFIGPITVEVESNVRSIAQRGRELGREPGRVGQLGDSISNSSAFLRNVLLDGIANNETGHDYSTTLSWINPHSARESSFYFDGGKGPDYGNSSGWTLADLTDNGHPQRAVVAGDGKTPGNFSWAVVMIGSNDINKGNWDHARWRRSLSRFVEELIELGVVPVLSTIPPQRQHADGGKVPLANMHIRDVADEVQIPLADFHDLIFDASNRGWDGSLISDDGIHPSAGGGGRDFSRENLQRRDGYALRTKLTLDVGEVLKPLMVGR